MSKSAERDMLDLETMLREQYRWGEDFVRLSIHVGPRRYRFKVRHVTDPKGSAEVAANTSELRAWQRTRVGVEA